MRKTLAAFAVAGLAALGSSPSRALPCSVDPFSDVLAASSSCSSVEWLKNRQVTLGCGGSLYCADGFVTRLQMALFMQRLADAVVQLPVATGASPGNATLTPAASANVHCATTVALVGWPRAIAINGHASFRFASGGGNVGMQLLYTDDGNTQNWKVVPSAQAMVAGSTSDFYGSPSSSGVLIVPAGTPIKLGIGVFSVTGDTGIADLRCNLTARIQSRTGSGTPFDEQY